MIGRGRFRDDCAGCGAFSTGSEESSFGKRNSADSLEEVARDFDCAAGAERGICVWSSLRTSQNRVFDHFTRGQVIKSKRDLSSMTQSFHTLKLGRLSNHDLAALGRLFDPFHHPSRLAHPVHFLNCHDHSTRSIHVS